MESDAPVPIRPDFADAATRTRLDQLHRLAQVGCCVNGVTHDINNHLGAILAYTELLSLESGLSPEAQRMLQEIISGVSRCSDLISRLTDIARDEKTSSSVVDPGIIMKRALLLRTYAFQTSRIKVETHYQTDMPSIEVDIPKIQLALISLLMNAQESLKTVEHKLVRIHVTADHEKTEFAIWSSSPPLSPETSEAAFQPFHTSKDGPHFGLGLTAAKQYVELHRGTLTYDADRGFVITIPRNAP